jgi:hypothetical protein
VIFSIDPSGLPALAFVVFVALGETFVGASFPHTTVPAAHTTTDTSTGIRFIERSPYGMYPLVLLLIYYRPNDIAGQGRRKGEN